MMTFIIFRTSAGEETLALICWRVSVSRGHHAGLWGLKAVCEQGTHHAGLWGLEAVCEQGTHHAGLWRVSISRGHIMQDSGGWRVSVSRGHIMQDSGGCIRHGSATHLWPFPLSYLASSHPNISSSVRTVRPHPELASCLTFGAVFLYQANVM